ncbi:hypothetical protein TCAL_15441 [Tigriopus californicus]|uniref:Uncharacterized protein n=1 Tax=Tigriopus californicus TaxID=6832 RepID=A0A553PSX8_TIGCA|nr:hypothetical protein TCAL_15441 [Tigriopus californicus]
MVFKAKNRKEGKEKRRRERAESTPRITLRLDVCLLPVIDLNRPWLASCALTDHHSASLKARLSSSC